MEPITTALTGLALARSGISFIKENMNTIQDAAQIGQQLSNIFQGFDEFNNQRYAPKLGFKDVADEMIQYKIMQEQMADLKLQINLRFGHGFYESIIAERKKRIEEKKENERKIRVRKRKQQEDLMTFGLSILVAISLVGIGMVIILF
jgi:hypothetical protein